ncbi:ACP S-malonyltransferase [Vallitalea maricola]|uniref:Uncharacterized protein n=1 Tax=Vallitalea maricola TaxID=3074433 RepID=A0ACB5UQ88_9FIRM|nr:hypothetical protein AN2V17_42690 [Vallitalea sp. AN17-2]
MKVVFMFSGQGSQYYNMGLDLYNNNTIFKKYMNELDQIVIDNMGKSIIDVLYRSGSKNPFDNVLYTSVAIFMVEYSLANLLIETGINPDYVIGSSIGEYTSAAVSNVMSYDDTIRAILKLSQLVKDNCKEGSMLAVLENRKIYDDIPILKNNSEMAAVNFDSHFVLSGSIEGINEIQKYLKSQEIVCAKLPVRYAFHSSMMDIVATGYKDYLRTRILNKPQINYISCVTGGHIKDIKNDYYWDTVRKPIQFQNAVNNLDIDEEYYLIDVGPSGTLANFSKRIHSKGIKPNNFQIMTPFYNELKNLEMLTKYFPNGSKPSIKISSSNNNNKLTYMFPGQGSQVKGMGAGLFEEFRQLTNKASDILGYSIEELCIEDLNDLLSRTDYTQPALYVVTAMSYLKKIKETGQKPDFVIGHSLGEYVALFAAGAYDFETGLNIVKKRGELMNRATGGGMAAVIGLTSEEVEKVLIDNKLNTIDIANLNSMKQIVISGMKTDIEKAEEIFSSVEGTMMFIPLKTSGAFHSRYMEDARKEFEDYLYNISFSNLEIPVISNVNAREYTQRDIKTNLIEQINHSVRWEESIRYLIGFGKMEFEEIGPGNVLTKLVQRIKRESK